MAKMHETFSKLGDPRVVGRSSHLLTDILILSVLAVICGMDTYDAIELFGKAHYDELKNIAQLEHSRHRSFNNFIVNAVSTIAAYCFFPKKPAISIEHYSDNQLMLYCLYRTHIRLLYSHPHFLMISLLIINSTEAFCLFLWRLCMLLIYLCFKAHRAFAKMKDTDFAMHHLLVI